MSLLRRRTPPSSIVMTHTPSPNMRTAMKRRTTGHVVKEIEPPPEARAGGGIVEMSDDEKPFSDILAKARNPTREVRGGELLHVSDLIGKCIRRIALIEKFKMTVHATPLSLTDEITFGQGDVIHDIIKARATRGEPHSVWGNWECLCKQHHTQKPCLFEEVDQADLCPGCNTPRSRYKEVPMLDKELGIVGTPDMILYLHLYEAFHVNEIKSMNHKDWLEIVRPKPEHVIQALFYWFLMHRRGFTLTDKVSVLYVTKGWQFGNALAYKEFTFCPTSSLKRLNPHLEDAQALKAARLGGGLPLRTCATEQAPEAKKCDACRVCFKGNDEAPTQIKIADALRRTPARR